MSRLLAVGSHGTLYVGPLPRVERHLHSAASIAVGVREPLRISTDGERWATCSSVYIPPAVAHAIEPGESDVAIFFVAPEADLQHHLITRYGLPTSQLAHEPGIPADWARLSWESSLSAADIHRRVGRELARGFVARAEPTDARIAAVTARMRMDLSLNHRAADLARMVHLSPSRLSALFRANIGMPMRRYRVWERLRSAATAIARGHSYSDAAALSGFSDAAHFSSSARSIFGISPRDILGTEPQVTIRL